LRRTSALPRVNGITGLRGCIERVWGNSIRVCEVPSKLFKNCLISLQTPYGRAVKRSSSNRLIRPSKLSSISCCQTLTTRQPILRSFAKLFRSRRLFFWIFLTQNSESRPFHNGNRYPCQKSPSTKTTIRSCTNTMSGVPGREETCFRKRHPLLKSSERTRVSMLVSRFLTRLIQ
jgi:hypothetical protein